MYFKSSLFLTSLIVGSSTSTLAYPTSHEPSPIHLSEITFNGNGCPVASPVTFDADGRVLIPGLTQMIQGPGVFSRFCRMSSALSLSPGYYVSGIKTWVGISGQKSLNGASLKLAVSHRILGTSIKSAEVDYPSGVSFDSKSQRIVLPVEADLNEVEMIGLMCQKSTPEGIFQSTLSVNGQVESEEGFLNFNEAKLPLKFKIELSSAKCPTNL
jgi:hypothetical protein